MCERMRARIFLAQSLCAVCSSNEKGCSMSSHHLAETLYDKLEIIEEQKCVLG